MGVWLGGGVCGCVSVCVCVLYSRILQETTAARFLFLSQSDNRLRVASASIRSDKDSVSREQASRLRLNRLGTLDLSQHNKHFHYCSSLL